ncbi:hypothetical protein NT6N_35500 [Oceaniferula spumae]|uniref:Uncharacterized protein n=1 Tax=Oceaniferula spumae TaxID=2979115 RepID=A0AAT9FRF4_9BACT
MKTPSIILASTLALTASVFADQAPPAIPVGTLKIDQMMVRQGVAPTFSWKIEYPAVVTDVVDITPDDEIIPKTKLRVKVSMVGVGMTDQTGLQYPAKAYMRFGSGGWQFLFSGIGSVVQPETVLINKVVQPGETLRYAAKLNYGNYGYYYNDSSNIKVLKNGDTPPNVAAGYAHQTSVASYLRPYVKNGKIALGPMDVIYVSELTHSNPGHFGYDMQDSITLVRFEKIEN